MRAEAMSTRIRVLYVHPTNRNRELYCRILTRLGHDVAVASDGIECIQAFRRTVPDVLILSQQIHWGGADGVLDVLHSERRLGRTQILLSEHAGTMMEADHQNETFVPFESTYDVLA